MASIAPELPVLARDQAFESLYRRYVKDVYHYALALLRNPADAEDVTQTTFMNAYRAFQRGDEIRKPQNWLIKIAHNVARTRYARASRRVKEVPLEDHVDQLALPEEEKPNIEGILRALGRLPFNQRAALVMRELEGRSYAEIADTLDVSVSAVETLIFRARKSLKVRASALRALAAVPLPGSLAGLFEGGGIAVGGGALTGGFVVKATVALVAGALATSLGGDNAGPAVAAQKQAAARSAAAAQLRASSDRPASAVVASQTTAKAPRVTRRAANRTHRAGAGTSTLDRTHVRPTGSQPAAASSSTTSSSTTSSSGTSSTQVSAPVTNTVATVQETVAQTVAATVPTLPVQVPSVPTLPPPPPPPPIEPPPPPKLP